MALVVALALAKAAFPEGAPDIAYAASIYSEALLDVPLAAEIDHTGLPPGADAAIDTLAMYVDLTGLELPPILEEPVVCGLTTAVGCYDGTKITLVPTLSAEQRFYVTLHELLHWAGFGTPETEARARAVWRAEHSGEPPIFYRADGKHPGHWDTTRANGKHFSSHMIPAAELMDPHIQFSLIDRRASAYLSAASLAACPTFAGRALWCVDDSDCQAGAECLPIGKLMPRRCSTDGYTATADDIALDRAAVMGYTALGAIGVVIITVGVASVAGW